MMFKACFALLIPNDCKFRLESLLRFILVKSTCRILSSKCAKTLNSLVLDNRTSYREFKGSFELVGIRATDFTSCISQSNVVFVDQITFEVILQNLTVLPIRTCVQNFARIGQGIPEILRKQDSKFLNPPPPNPSIFASAKTLRILVK